MKKTKRSQKKTKKILNCEDSNFKNKLFTELMDFIPDVIYFKDKQGRLIMVNQAHAKGLNLKPEQVAGKTDFDFFPKSRAKLMFKDDMQVIKKGKPVIDKVERATRADGVDNYVSTTKIPRYDDKGNTIGLIGITRDITHRMQLKSLSDEKERMDKKLQGLEELTKMKSEFVAVVSHELRTPLAIIRETIMLICDQIAGPVNKKQGELLITVRNNIARLNKIIEDLLDISRIERGVLKLRYSLVDFNDLLLEQFDFLKKLAEQNDVNFKYQLPAKKINIFIDAGRVNQIVSNLVTNAIKFTEQGGEVKVEVKIFERKVRIGVIDNGVGIAKNDLQKLFSKFVQVSKSVGYERKGLGLGLSISRELIERHGGEIWAESRLGVGSKFYFTLPHFYNTANRLDKPVRNRINNLLNRGIALYLINPLIVNFGEFKKRISVEPHKLFDDITTIIEATISEFSKKDNSPQLILKDFRRGEYSLIFPGATEAKATKLCSLLKDRIKNYFVENRIKDVFVNLGFLSYPPKGDILDKKRILANVHIKNMYIGSNIRVSARVVYKANIDVVLSGAKSQKCETIDISKKGICFNSKRPLKTDAQIRIKLQLPNKTPFSIKSRVAWVGSTDEAGARYMIGCEFIDWEESKRGAFFRFLRNNKAIVNKV